MIFRYCGNISVSMQRYFLKVRGVKKFMFRCHTLTHGTDLRRLPQGVEGRRLEAITNIIIAKARKIRGFNNLLTLANPMLGVSLFILI